VRGKARNTIARPRAKPPQRRSREAVRDATLKAAYDLLTEIGLSGVSLDEVSRRSGVAKTTIYRHWANRSALLLEACMQYAPRVEVPDTGSLRGDLTAVAGVMAHRLQTGRWSSALPSVIDAAERDKAIAELQTLQHKAMMSVFDTIAARAKQRGDFPADIEPSELTAAIAGPLFYRRWFSRQKLDDAFVRRVVERVLRNGT
jgi:AcrR family transcriptional regulator